MCRTRTCLLTLLILLQVRSLPAAQPTPERDPPAVEQRDPLRQDKTNATHVSDAPTLRVLSYNIHHGQGTDGHLDLARIARVILQARPDVVALQEVDVQTARSGGLDQADKIARLTGMFVVFGANLAFQGGHYGNAVLSRWPLANSRNVLLPSRDQGEQRGLLIVSLPWPDARRSTRLFATHLDHRSDDTERLECVARIKQLALEEADMPSLLVGDLNATRGSRVLARLAEQWAVAGAQETPTIPVEQPERQIDFVLYRPTVNWRVAEVNVLDEAVASDHRPILVVLEAQ